jgi:hypothetical protein
MWTAEVTISCPTYRKFMFSQPSLNLLCVSYIISKMTNIIFYLIGIDITFVTSKVLSNCMYSDCINAIINSDGGCRCPDRFATTFKTNRIRIVDFIKSDYTQGVGQYLSLLYSPYQYTTANFLPSIFFFATCGFTNIIQTIKN